MAAQETNMLNAFETTLSAPMGTTDLTATVASTTGLSSPCYLVVEPDSDSKREYILFDGTFTGTTFVATVIANRYLTGSAAGSGLSHAAGSVVRMAPLAQHFEDVHDRIDGLTHGSLSGLASDDHTQYLNVGRHDANDHSALAGEHSGITAAGDLTYGSAAGVAGNVLAIGAAESLLRSTGTAPAWLAKGTAGQVLATTDASVLGWETHTATARLYLATAQSIPNATWTQVAFDTQDYASPNTTDFTYNLTTGEIAVVNEGVYLIQVNIGLAGNATGRREVRIQNSGTDRGQHTVNAVSGGAATRMAMSVTRLMLASAPVHVDLYQDSGGALNSTNGNNTSWLSVTKLGPSL